MLVNWITPADDAELYIHKELFWVPKGPNSPVPGVSLKQIFNWLLSEARTPAEKNMVQQEEAFDFSHTIEQNPDIFGNGVDANSLLGWGMIGVDPFQPFGPDMGLSKVIQEAADGNLGVSEVGKSAKKEAKKSEQQTSLLDQADAANGSMKAHPVPALTDSKVLEQIKATLDINAMIVQVSRHPKTLPGDPNSPVSWQNSSSHQVSISLLG